MRTTHVSRWCWCATACVIAAHSANAQTVPASDTLGARWSVPSEEGLLDVTIVATGFRIPTAIAALPDGSLLVADRFTRTLSRVNPARGTRQPISGLPEIWIKPGGTPSEGAGLHDVRLAPDFTTSGVLYLSYSVLTPGGSTLAVARAVLRGEQLHELREIYRQPHAIVDNTDHFGGRMVLSNTALFVTTGDRYAHRDSAQQLTSTLGKVLRLHTDGRIPADNPFRTQPGASAEIWSLGHRNPQGLAVHPQTGALWLTEHGPRGGDEVNVVQRGHNYGWPRVTYGEEYEGGPVGSGARLQRGLDAPILYFKPSIAPSDLLFHSGTRAPAWRGNLFLGGMGTRHLSRLVVDGTRVLHEERLLADRRWRVRAVCEAVDGSLYVGVDGGMLVRVAVRATQAPPSTAASRPTPQRTP